MSQYIDFTDCIRVCVSSADINGLETKRRSLPPASCTMTALLQQTAVAKEGFHFNMGGANLSIDRFTGVGGMRGAQCILKMGGGRGGGGGLAPVATTPPPPRSYAYGIKTLPDMECIF